MRDSVGAALCGALGRPVASEGVSKGCSHCRDAPWGVSEAATSPVLSQTPRGRAVALGIVLSAPETPHGASLQWGAQTESPLSRHPLRALMRKRLSAGVMRANGPRTPTLTK